MPVIDLAPVPNVAVDVAAWAVIHAATGYAAHRIPLRRLQRDGWLLRTRPGEVRVYERLGVRRWKDALPEAGALFAGGLSKRTLPTAAQGGLERFAAETRRAEIGHWLALAGGPLFLVWNPPAVAVVMVAYGIAVNAPFIVIQRYNRARVSRVIERRRRSTSSSDASTVRRRSADITGSNMP